MIEPPRAGIEDGTQPLEATVAFPNKAGLHARSAALLIKATTGHHAAVTLHLGGRTASAASLIELLRLGARQGHVVRVQATGPDAEAALSEITTMIASGFNEE